MSYSPRYDRGDWKCICDACGKLLKASQLKKRWDGYMVCDKDWEPRQPQDFVRGVADYQAPPFTRPEPSDSFIQVGITYIQSIIASVTSTASLTYHVLQRLTQQITATATSVASIIAVYLPFSTKVPKTLDGASVNKTTLG